ncbi:MAG: tetraacyldisaccharide 4'-kinase [Lentisphaerae bacterium]|nr:tetraacyldisaccharide 4'-kinase [Lentisphaerota bacterium]
MKRRWKYRLERFERYVVGLIQDRHDGLPLTRGERLFLDFLRSLSRLYRTIIQARHFVYAKGLIRHHTLGCQVISVGNLTVGGTGKTPVVEVFARELQKEGRRVAILSRGYKKEEPPWGTRVLDRFLGRDKRQPPRIVSDGKTLLLDSAMSGDEPYMLASNLPNVCVLVDRDRVKSGKYAINKLGCDTLVLDDGFQYLALKPRVQIVLVDRTNPFGNEHCLPRGILREPVKNIRRADFIFITKSNGTGIEELKAKLRQHNQHAEIIECKHCPRYVQNLYTSEQQPLEFLKDRRIVAVSAIAAPKGFESELERLGARILRRFAFADHHRYSQQEIIDTINSAKVLGAEAIITTEKDAVRFPRLDRRDVPVYFLRVDIEILSGKEDFRSCIARICFR